MENMHLAGEDEDDIYEGFNDFDAALDTQVSHLVTSIFKLDI